MELDEELAEIGNRKSGKSGIFLFGILAEMGCIFRFDNGNKLQKQS